MRRYAPTLSRRAPPQPVWPTSRPPSWSSSWKVRANLDKEKAEEDAKGLTSQYQALTLEIENIRVNRRALLDGANLPLPGLSVEDGALTYQGKRWSDISGADQLREFGAWLEQEGLQAIATRVSTGGECSVIIEDGQAVGADTPQPDAGQKKTWKAGTF